MVKISWIFPNTEENNPSLHTASAQIEEWNGWLQTEKSSPGSFKLFAYDLWAHAGYKTFKIRTNPCLQELILESWQ